MENTQIIDKTLENSNNINSGEISLEKNSKNIENNPHNIPESQNPEKIIISNQNNSSAKDNHPLSKKTCTIIFTLFNKKIKL